MHSIKLYDILIVEYRFRICFSNFLFLSTSYKSEHFSFLKNLFKEKKRNGKIGILILLRICVCMCILTILVKQISKPNH